MRLLPAFLKLIRWPNLLFIGLTQLLFYYCILPFVYELPLKHLKPILSQENFYLLLLSSILIASAGYIINDYFDLNIDRVNKPEKLIVETYIKRRSAILLHLLTSLTGLIISMYVGYKIHNILIPLLNLLAIAALWFYSTTFKKMLLIGNILISLLTAWVIFILMIAEYAHTRSDNEASALPKLLKVSILYGGFAFIVSLVREVIKDMEDIQGDAKYGCHTMPIVWGIPVSKVFVAVWMSVLLGILVIVQFYFFNLGWWPASLYCIVSIIGPLILQMKKLYIAQNSQDYHNLSSSIKWIMLAGIFSMIFFRLLI